MAPSARQLAALSAGAPVVLVDQSGSAELVVAAGLVTTSSMAFLVRHGSGFVRVALTGETCDRLGLSPMAVRGPHRCRQAVAIDAATGVSTGISAADRCRAARLLADPATAPDDLHRPGHTLPVRAWPTGGSVDEPGVVEAAVELARASGNAPAAVLCGLVSSEDPRHMARSSEQVRFARSHGLEMVSAAECLSAAVIGSGVG